MECNVPTKLNLKDQKFGKLIVLHEDSDNSKNFAKWICQCSCGNLISVRAASLKNGHTTSCGCIKYDRIYTPKEFNARIVWWNFKKEISFEDFMKISQCNCHWCGIEPSTISCVKNRGQLFIDNPFIWNGLDRIDNSKDHNKNNVVSCCKWCNISRNERTIDEFLEWNKRVYEHQRKLSL